MKKSTKILTADIGGSLTQLVEDSRVSCVRSVGDNSNRPSFLILNPNFGLIAVEVGALDESAEQVRIKLNAKVDSLKKQLRKVSDVSLIRVSVVNEPKKFFEKISDTSFVVGESQLKSVNWTKELTKASLDEVLTKKVRQTLWPEFSFVKPAYTGTRDIKKPKKDLLQIEIDREQSAVATRAIKDLLIVSGPPGAGKTLVLCARAKWFAKEFPTKKCLFVVFNSMLEKLIRSQNPEWPSNVELVTIRTLLKANGHNSLVTLLNDFNLEHEEHDRRASRLVKQVLEDSSFANFDSLLVDEWQDFREPYINYLLANLKADSQGAMFAGDSAQAIYTNGAAFGALDGRSVEEVSLNFSYRCTRQILDVAVALDKEYKVEGSSKARDGEPVSLVQASYWATQADGIAWEISKLLNEDNRHPSEIAVLCTTKSGANYVANALEKRNIKFELLTKFWDDVSPSDEKVNIMTVHGSKGYGFNVVLLMGFETLKDRDGQPKLDMWGRVGFVGVTRAQDLLFIFYGKETRFIDNLGNLKENTLTSRTYPSDYAT